MNKTKELTVILALVSVPLSGSLCGEEEVARVVAQDGGAGDAAPEVDAGSISGDAEVGVELDAATSTVSDAAIDDEDAADASVAMDAAPDAATPDAAMPRVFFVSPRNGEIIGAQTVFWFDVEGFTLMPAFRPNGAGEGHLHLFVDRSCATPGDVIERVPDAVFDLDEGQRSAFVVLSVGIHALCVQAGTASHVALPLTDAIVVEVR
ncbi:DUF4399 domain-containing protein [Myxococcota bacterium]|nr:DUF4399 domain-containing protein [Myxococcota bacterium]